MEVFLSTITWCATLEHPPPDLQIASSKAALASVQPDGRHPWLWAGAIFERFPRSSGCQPQDLANCGMCHPLPYGDQGTTHKQDADSKTMTEVFPAGPALRSCLPKIQSIIFSTFHHHAQDTKLMRHSLSCSNTHLAFHCGALHEDTPRR